MLGIEGVFDSGHVVPLGDANQRTVVQSVSLASLRVAIYPVFVECRLRDRHTLCHLSSALSQIQVISFLQKGNRVDDSPSPLLPATRKADSGAALPQDGALSLNFPLSSLEALPRLVKGLLCHPQAPSLPSLLSVVWSFSMQELLHVCGEGCGV